jgi:hypothetical protein
MDQLRRDARAPNAENTRLFDRSNSIPIAVDWFSSSESNGSASFMNGKEA